MQYMQLLRSSLLFATNMPTRSTHPHPCLHQLSVTLCGLNIGSDGSVRKDEWQALDRSRIPGEWRGSRHYSARDT